ncbi:MAG: leucine-rich repeat domain-containing protein [Mycoplasmoidaceae bacterium]|nr:leucine-rich repeat domain-containing protein [Mycoplasmoidaceae bacterium]
MNKKLIKTIASIICGLGTTTIIPCVASSCGNSSNNILPKEVYKFSDDGKTLLGFKDAFLNDPNSKIYKDKFTNCDTMRIPANATSIAYFAFIDDPAKKNSTIPNFITKLTFAKESVCSSIELGAFAFCSTLIFVNLPNSLIEIGNSAFQGCSILTSIDFSNATNLSSIGVSVFRDCS